MSDAVRVAIVGIHGHGNSHVVRAQHLQRTGDAVLVAVADLRPASPGTLDASVREFGSLADLLAEVSVDVVVLCTPIHTHFEFTTLALEAGADVLLEKPPVRSLEEFSALAEVIRSTGRRCQVGFQSLGSHAITAIRDRIAVGEIGSVTGVSASGCWVRTRDYWQRAAWAGKRILDGIEVVDGVVTNPLAHAVATALALAEATRGSQVASVELDQYRANEIDADDTSVVRITTTAGLPVTLALTLCAAERSEPSVTVQGTSGRIVFYYTLDIVQVFRDDRPDPTTTQHDRTFLLDNLVGNRRGAASSLVCDFADTEAFTVVLDAVRRADHPRRIPAASVDWVGDGGDAHAVVRDIERWVIRAGREHKTFAELGAPWTTA